MLIEPTGRSVLVVFCIIAYGACSSGDGSKIPVDTWTAEEKSHDVGSGAGDYADTPDLERQDTVRESPETLVPPDLTVPDLADLVPAELPATDLSADVPMTDLPSEVAPGDAMEVNPDLPPVDAGDDVYVPSPCFCDDATDCDEGLVCETEINLCVASKCIGKSCPGDQECDPYKGKCMPKELPPEAAIPCDTTDDCPQGINCPMVCNTYLGFCIEHDCCMDGCFPPKTCSPLLHTCANCFTDCDCEEGETCGANTYTCSSCDESKINFTQDNYPAYEFYEVCIPDGMADAIAALQQIQPGIYCGVAGVFVGCTGGEVGCHGEFEFQQGNKKLTDASWEEICAISALDSVSKIGGGHYVL